LECYGRESRVIYPPVDVDFFTPAETPLPREDYYLCVSALVPYKRIDLAVTACRLMGRRLVVIGTGPDERRLAQRAGPLATFLGWQSDEEIRQHLRRCRALLFPGHEDFGIVPVEAQACGAPVIALRRGGATETVLEADHRGPGNGVFFDQPNCESLVQAMSWLENNPASVSADVARQQATRFRSERYEQELVTYLESVYRERLARAI
jgi:glycosyltransferase involved in cell wall biosynthesis